MTSVELIDSGLKLCKTLRPAASALSVHTVYNPLEYAWTLHEQYLKKFGNSEKRVLFLGMNPGPWGMAQTGIPFGEIAAVRDWMGIRGEVGKPIQEHPKRPVQGLNCARSEVSGRRLWGLFRDQFGAADAFFQNNFVLNYCPLFFMEESGKNITPDKLPVFERKVVDAACDAHLAEVIAILKPEFLVGVGKYAEACFRRVAPDGAVLGSILHPSPASPVANRDFAGTAIRQLAELGVLT